MKARIRRNLVQVAGFIVGFGFGAILLYVLRYFDVTPEARGVWVGAITVAVGNLAQMIFDKPSSAKRNTRLELDAALETLSAEFGQFLLVTRLGDDDPPRPDGKRAYGILTHGDVDKKLVDTVRGWLDDQTRNSRDD
jgi:hypothetical protein